MKKLMLMTVVALAGCAAVADYVLDFSYSSEETKWKRDTRVITDVNIASKNFTLEAWVYRRFDQNGYKIFAQYPSTTGTYSLFLGGADGKADTLDVFFRSSIGWWTPGVPLTRNAWHHVALVKDDTGVAVLYVDGEEKARVQDDRLRDFYPNQTDQKLWLGNTYSDGTGAEGSYNVGFPGYLCEMRCWNVARTGDEIRAYLHRRLNGDEAGLVGYWPLNEGGGAAVVNRRTGVASAVLGTGAWKSDDTMSFVNRRDVAFDAGAHEVSAPQNLSEGDVRYLPAEGAQVKVSGKLTGHGAVVVNGAETSGEVEFTGDNDFSGGLTVTRGRFKTADLANIGPGAVDILTGTFAYTGTAAATLANAFYFHSGPGRNAILLNVGDLTLCGPLTCFGNKEGGFVKRGAGTLTLDVDADLQFENAYNGGLVFPDNGDSTEAGTASGLTIADGTLVVPAGRSLSTTRFYVGKQTTTAAGAETAGHLVIAGAAFCQTIMLGTGNGTKETAPTPLASTITVDGGSLDAQWIHTGSNPRSVAGFNAHPKIILNAGSITLTTRLMLGETAPGAGTLDLNGGVLSTPVVESGSGNGYLNLNGGTLRFTAPATLSKMTRIDVLAGGAVIENDDAVTIGKPLRTGGNDGGLVKKGSGALTLTQVNTYVGKTRAEGGEVFFDNATGFPGGSIELAGGSVKIRSAAYSGTISTSCAALAEGNSFVEATGSIDLTGARVVLSDGDSFKSDDDRPLVVLKAGGAIVGRPTLDGGDKWSCRTSDDGKSIVLYRRRGFMIIFK